MPGRYDANRSAEGTDRRCPPDSAGAREWLTLVTLGLFLAVLSTTVVSVALPDLGRDLHATSAELQWVVALFAVGSLITGTAPTLPALLAGRVAQAAGVALAVPGSLIIILAVFTGSAIRRTVVIWQEPRQRAGGDGLPGPWGLEDAGRRRGRSRRGRARWHRNGCRRSSPGRRKRHSAVSFACLAESAGGWAGTPGGTSPGHVRVVRVAQSLSASPAPSRPWQTSD